MNLRNSMKQPKRALWLAAVVLAFGAVLAPGATFGAMKPVVQPPALLKAGVLVMAINASVPPSMYLNKKGEIVGYRAEMGRELASRLGLKAEFVNVPFAAQIPGLTGGRWDVSVSGAYIIPSRTRVVEMIATESQGVSISTPKSNPKNINEEKDLAGLRVGVEQGGFDERTIKKVSKRLVAQNLKPIDIRTFNGASVAYLALSAGQIDAVAANDPIARYYQNESKNAFQNRIRGMNLTLQSMAVKGGNGALSQAIVKALDSMKADGWYDRLVKKYNFGPIKGDKFKAIYTP
jgi:polar amino acid transport system substrate-binding protein